MRTLSVNLKIIIAAILISLAQSAPAQSKIPATWQKGMKLTMSYGGGMRYYSYHLVISDTGSHFEENVEGRVTKYRLRLTEKDLSQLLGFLREKQLDQVEEEMTGPVHDKGTESLVLSWDNQVIGVSESYGQRVKEKHRDNYHAICNYIDTLRDRVKKKM